MSKITSVEQNRRLVIFLLIPEIQHFTKFVSNQAKSLFFCVCIKHFKPVPSFH